MRMLKIYLISLVALISSRSFAWICEEAASQRSGTSIHSCGVGVAEDESEARSKAFDSAKLEFTKVCDASDDCKNHKTHADPQRNDCTKKDGIYRCYRMVIFKILEEQRSSSEERAASSTSPIAEPESERKKPKENPIQTMKKQCENGNNSSCADYASYLLEKNDFANYQLSLDKGCSNEYSASCAKIKKNQSRQIEKQLKCNGGDAKACYLAGIGNVVAFGGRDSSIHTLKRSCKLKYVLACKFLAKHGASEED